MQVVLCWFTKKIGQQNIFPHNLTSSALDIMIQ